MIIENTPDTDNNTPIKMIRGTITSSNELHFETRVQIPTKSMD